MSSEIFTIPPKQVESVVDEPILSAGGEFGLKLGKVGPPLVDDYYLTIDDRLAGNIQSSGNY